MDNEGELVNMSTENVDLILNHGTIVTQDDLRRVISDGSIAVRDGRIIGLGPVEEIAARYQAVEAIDVSGQIVFPGLINTHTHLFQVSTKGLGESWAVQEWVKQVTAPTAIHISPEEIYTFCLTGCLEHIHCGVTTLVDMSYRAHSYELHEQNIQAIKDSGLRGRYTSIISDYGKEYGVFDELMMPIDWFLEEYSRLLDQYPADDRLQVWMAIGAPWVISDEGIRKALEFSDKRNIPIVIHISENEVDNELSQQRYGKNIVPFMDEIGFLSPKVLAIHCVVTDDTDIELYAKNDVKISYNPVSNMYLGSGIPPIIKMDKAGLAIGIGVDGAGSNNSQDMIESMKVAALLQKVAHGDASVVDAQKVLDWATRDAARTVWMEDEIGSLEVGKRADLFVMAVNTSKIAPVHDPVASLVYSSGEENVVMTIADGKILMRDRVIQNIDEYRLIEECQDAAVRLADRCGSNVNQKRSFRPGNIQEAV